MKVCSAAKLAAGSAVAAPGGGGVLAAAATVAVSELSLLVGVGQRRLCLGAD